MQYAKEYSYAQLFAESKISELGKGIPIEEGKYGGDINDKYVWEISIAPDFSLSSAEEDVVQSYKVLFSIKWDSYGKDRSIEVLTYKLATEG